MSIQIPALANLRVAEFCAAHSIGPYVETAIALAQQAFRSMKDMKVYIDDDPEIDGEWIIINVTVQQDVDDFLKDCDRCVALWATDIPNSTLKFIRLSYDIM